MHRTDIADSIVRITARPEPGPDDTDKWTWVAAVVWTDRMLAALDNGVRGGKWHSLIDKVYAPLTLRAEIVKVVVASVVKPQAAFWVSLFSSFESFTWASI